MTSLTFGISFRATEIKRVNNCFCVDRFGMTFCKSVTTVKIGGKKLLKATISVYFNLKGKVFSKVYIQCDQIWRNFATTANLHSL